MSVDPLRFVFGDPVWLDLEGWRHMRAGHTMRVGPYSKVAGVVVETHPQRLVRGGVRWSYVIRYRSADKRIEETHLLSDQWLKPMSPLEALAFSAELGAL